MFFHVLRLTAISGAEAVTKNVKPETNSDIRPKHRIRAVIFDLDDTLYDCLGQRVLGAHRAAAEAMVAAGLGAGVDEVLAARLESCASDPRLEAVDQEVCRRFGAYSWETISRFAQAAFLSHPVTALSPFPETGEVLRALAGAGVRIFVVTFGNPEVQRAKVEALGLETVIAADQILYLDHWSKADAFRRILQENSIDAADALVVGDRPDREIEAGNRLGFHTVRMRHGEFARVEASREDECAQYEISSLAQIFDLPFTFGLQNAV